MSTDLSILMSRRDSASQHHSGHDYSIATYVDAYNWRLNDNLMKCLLLLVRVRIYKCTRTRCNANYKARKLRRNENARDIHQLKGLRKEDRKTQFQLDRGKKERKKICLSQLEYRSPTNAGSIFSHRAPEVGPLSFGLAEMPRSPTSVSSRQLPRQAAYKLQGQLQNDGSPYRSM